jgi:hypothetical protein
MAIIHWDMHRWDTEYSLSNLGDYLEVIESQFESARIAERSRIPQKLNAGLSEEEYFEWEAKVHAYKEQYEQVFPSNIRYSFIVLMHIFFETRLKDACDEISKRRNLTLTESDLNGSSIERANKFLDKIAGIKVKDHHTWQWLKDLQKIRDCIVHTNGRVSLSRDKNHIVSLCRKGKGLSINGESLIIEKSYCSNSIKVIKIFFKHLFDSAGFGPSTPVVEEGK